MDHSLLCPMQLRENDVTLDECPKSLLEAPAEMNHSILGTTDEHTELHIPLHLRGVVSTMHASKPSLHQYETLPHLELTSRDLEWNPHDPLFASREQALLTDTGELKPPGDRPNRSTMNSMASLANPPRFSLAGLTSLRERSLRWDGEHSLLQTTDCALTDEAFRPLLQDGRLVSVTKTSNRQGVSPEHLADKWKIPLHQAKNTIAVTTQRGARHVANPAIGRRFRTNDRMLRHNRIPHTVFADAMKASTKSKRQNSCAQVHCTDFRWQRACPMTKKSEAHCTLSSLFKDVGVPNVMAMDGAQEQVQGDFRRKLREADCKRKQTEPHTPFSNAAEGSIRELKKSTGRKMTSTRAPKRLWDDCLEYESLIKSHTALDLWQSKGEVPQTLMTGQTADMSQLYEFGWYDWCMHHDSSVKFPDDKFTLGRWLGPSIDVGPAMTAKVLKPDGITRHVSTHRNLTEEEWHKKEILDAMAEFDSAMCEAPGPEATDADFEEEFEDAATPSCEPHEDDCNKAHTIPDRDECQSFDECIGAEVVLPCQDRMISGKVKHRKRNVDGTLKGTRNSKQLFDTRAHVVEFPDNMEAECTANVIAENVCAQCNTEGEQFLILQGITDHERNRDALSVDNGTVRVDGKDHIVKTTEGWKLCVQWKDGSATWENLAGLKESDPVEVAECAIAAGTAEEPAFRWWVPHALNERDRMIAKVNTRYHKRTHKFGFEVPKTVKRALETDRENGDDRWAKAIEKELRKVRVAIDIQRETSRAPVGCACIGCHVVFDVKMENFQFKARHVANGNETGTPASLTCASVVSRESVRIALTLAVLNGLEAKTSDIENAHLTAPTEEKLHTALGEEFGDDAGKHAIIARALCGTKSAGASFRNHLAECMFHLGCESCLADGDPWLKKCHKKDGAPYWGCMLLCADDAMCINHEAEKELHRLDHHFKMKEGSIGDPELCLGAKVSKHELDGFEPDEQVSAWGSSPAKHTSAAIDNVEECLAKRGRKLDKKARSPFRTDYRPELDTSRELDAQECNHCQSQTGTLRWMAELGRIDMMTEASELASQLALPGEGHLDAVFRMHSYLKIKRNSLVLFDPSYPEVDESQFPKRDWHDFHGDVKEEFPPDVPEALGAEVILRLFVDADYAGDSANRRSRTGFFIFMNEAPIIWHSEKQSRIENSAFGSEFIAMRTGLETSQGLRYKLRMMGVPLCTPTYIYGDNMSVIHDTSKPESVLKKKSNSACHHHAREAVAADECRATHISTHSNPADIATKPLPAGEKRDHLVGKVLHFFSWNPRQRSNSIQSLEFVRGD